MSDPRNRCSYRSNTTYYAMGIRRRQCASVAKAEKPSSNSLQPEKRAVDKIEEGAPSSHQSTKTTYRLPKVINKREKPQLNYRTGMEKAIGLKGMESRDIQLPTRLK